MASVEPPAGPLQPVVFHAARAGTGPHARLGARAVQPPGLRAGLGPRPRARACGRSAPACTPEPLNRRKVCGRCTCCLHAHGCLEAFPGVLVVLHTRGDLSSAAESGSKETLTDLGGDLELQQASPPLANF